MNLELAAPAHPYQKVQVSLLLSENAHQLAKKNGFDFAQMLLPYSTVQISIKEPLSQQVVQHNLHLDFRDLRRSGFLLSHTVFRFVLQESILESSVQRPEGISILSSSFYHSFMHWHEPPEHEFLQAYLACIFVVSTADSDPLGKLKELEAEQHKEQHGEVGNPTGARISPAYCVPSKWFFPNILKYYLLVHDNSLQPFDTEKSKELFAAICSRYGPSLCQMICLNSANPANPADAGMPDPWGPILRKDNLGLRAGVDLAKKNLISSGKATKPPTSESQKDLTVFAAPSTIPPVYSAPSLFPESASLLPPPLFTTSATFTVNPNHLPLSPTLGHSPHQTQLDNVLANHQQHQMTYAQIVADRAVNLENYAPQANSSTENAGQIFEEEEKPETTLHGRWLSAEDRQKLRKFVEDFVREILVPYAEKQLAEQGEIVLNRRSLAKSTFTSMRKWLQNAATTGPAAVSNQQHQQQRVLSISYPAESAESQSRRLADLAFVFGLYQYSNQIYQSLKKDFANDQAWLCHAGCLEMASTSSFLANWQQYSSEQVSANSTMKSSFLAMNRKQYPQRYMDNAVHFYANVCRQPFLALRALINGVQILTQLEMFSEAAEQLIRFNSSCTEIAMDDLFQVVLLEHAARLFAKTGNRRRKTDFYLATAGTRLLKFASEQQQNHNIFTAESLRRCKQLSRRFYEEVMASHSVTDRGWAWAEHYLLCQYITSI